jgi:DNA-directed RNA polymerase specialized sigma24 family protein
MPNKSETALLRILHNGDDNIAETDLLSRFVVDHDESAFSILMRRYARLVHVVAQRVLRIAHDDADVLQATFLILARKANLLKPDVLSGGFMPWPTVWLFICAASKASAARRNPRCPAAAVPTSSNSDDITWRELRMVLDEELALRARASNSYGDGYH